MNSDNLILAIETSRRKWGVSLLDGKREISHRIGSDTISGSEVLLTAISLLLEENQTMLRELKAIAVSQGPGSFTGIRVGLATARALAFGSRLICGGVSLFEAMALIPESSAEENEVFVVISAGRQQIYWQRLIVRGLLISSRSLACVEDFSLFLQRLKEVSERQREPDENLFVVLDDELTAKAVQNSEALHSQVKIIIASDNLSKYVGLRYEALLSENFSETIQNSFESTLPLYVREVRIGN